MKIISNLPTWWETFEIELFNKITKLDNEKLSNFAFNCIRSIPNSIDK